MTKFEIEFPIEVVFDAFETKNIGTGVKTEAPGGAILTIARTPDIIESRGMAFDAAPIFTAIVQFAGPVSAVALNLFSSWLYDKFKNSKGAIRRRVKINREWTEISLDGISKTVKESIEYDEKA